MPPIPDPHAIAVMVLTLIALVLFSNDRISLESSCLLVLISLVVGFELWPYQNGADGVNAQDFFLGFGHEALVAVCALMVAGQGLVRTGALEPVGRLLARLWGVSPQLSLLATLVIGGLLSAFVNNTPIVVLLLPILVSVSVRTGVASSSVLMPMGFATLLGGMTTTIGTSTNLLVVSVSQDMGLRQFDMFDFFVPASMAAAVGMLYLWLIAPRILPKRDNNLADSSPRIFTAELLIPENSPADGKTLSEASEIAGPRLQPKTIRRGRGVELMPLPDVVLKAGDRLLLTDTPDTLKAMESDLEATLYREDVQVDDEHPLSADNQQVAEIVVSQGSLLDKRTLQNAKIMERFQLLVLALHRPGRRIETMSTGIGSVRLRIGDVLLVQGSREQIAKFKQSGEMLVLDATMDVPHTRKAYLALSIMGAVVVLAALGILPIAVSATCGVMLMIATGCLNWREATRALSTPVILIVVVSLALGSALLKTGGADFLAQSFVAAVGDAPPAVMLSGLILLMAVLTNVVSNNAAAVIGTPIAIGIAQQLGHPAEPFVLAVLFGANMSYATPMAYKTNLLVMSAGNYKFSDFMRAGIPLTLIMWLTLSLILPGLYGL